MTKRSVTFSTGPTPHPAGQSSTPALVSMIAYLLVGNLTIRVKLSDRWLVDIHVADVLWSLPAGQPRHHPRIAGAVQRGGMHIQHGTAQDVGSRLYLDSDTLGPYVPLEPPQGGVEEYTFLFKARAPDPRAPVPAMAAAAPAGPAEAAPAAPSSTGSHPAQRQRSWEEAAAAAFGQGNIHVATSTQLLRMIEQRSSTPCLCLCSDPERHSGGAAPTCALFDCNRTRSPSRTAPNGLTPNPNPPINAPGGQMAPPGQRVRTRRLPRANLSQAVSRFGMWKNLTFLTRTDFGPHYLTTPWEPDARKGRVRWRRASDI